MEQDEQVICTISKDSNHISNQDLIAQIKNIVQTNNKHGKQFFAEKDKRKKIRKYQVESNK